ncbi:MAG TPA: hypothetical protein PLH33_01670, partial [Chitinophagaceae bacterium]|nr:hypothetical protein [Chitinophagaceae bacterium]
MFLILMSLMRWVLVLTYRTPTEKSVSLIDAYWLGFRFDLRFVSITMLLLYLVGTIPYLHPINKKWGNRVSFIIWSVFIVLTSIFYAADFAHYSYLRQRLNANILSFLHDAKISFGMMWQSYNLGWGILGLIVIVF